MTKAFLPDQIDVAAGEAGVTGFRLGMPHLGADGVRAGWLLRAVCHRQWQEMAAQAGVSPSKLRDAAGHRVMGSVVACTLIGDARAFREDDACSLQTEVVPRAASGWRGRYTLRNGAGARLSAELVTRFVRRSGPSNTRLETADMGPSFAPEREGDAARRGDVLMRLGAADKALAEANPVPPHRVFKIEREAHLNGVGLVYFADIQDMIARTEHRVVPELSNVWPMKNRRVHYFGNLDPGDTLEISVSTGVRAISPHAAVLVRSQAVRGSDGAVIAVAEGIYGD